MRVFFIQNDCTSSNWKTKIMPSSIGRFWTYMRPRARSAGVSAMATLTGCSPPAAGRTITRGPASGAADAASAGSGAASGDGAWVAASATGKRAASAGPAAVPF
jgi:hypothetical protein